jgi:hypothetical protein
VPTAADQAREQNDSLAARTEAEAFTVTTAADVHRGSYIDPGAGKVTLAAYAASWLGMQTFQASSRESVEMRLRRHILPRLGGCTLAQLAGQPSIVQTWLSGSACPHPMGESCSPRCPRS